MVGKVIISLVWVFWILAMSTVEGQDPSAVSQDDYDSLHAEVVELRKIKKIHQQMLPQGEKNYKMKDEYFPAYGSTLARVKKRGYIICGTYPDFPGFSEEVEEAEESKVWVGFDIDICRAVASAVLVINGGFNS